jgi:hypothetical protein
MKHYEVTYSLLARDRANILHGIAGMQYLKTVVQAVSPGQAMQIVESMFGGRDRVQVGSAYSVK